MQLKPHLRFEKRGEPKVQSERTSQKKQPRPPREEKIRTEVKLSGVEEQPGAEATVQQEEGSRRRRRGGRQRERSDRPERAPRENKQMAAKHPHPQQAVSQSMHEEKNAESAVPEPVPVLEQETPALVLTSSTPTVEMPVESVSVSHSEPLEPHETLPLMTSVTLAAVPEVAEAPHNAPPAQPAIKESVPEKSVFPFPVAKAAAQVEFPESNKEVSDLTSPGEAWEIGEKSETREHQEVQQPQPASVIESPDLVANGLVMVETIPEKIKQNETKAEAESTLPQGRRKRPPAMPVIAHEEPMVQIETHK